MLQLFKKFSYIPIFTKKTQEVRERDMQKEMLIVWARFVDANTKKIKEKKTPPDDCGV